MSIFDIFKKLETEKKSQKPPEFIICGLGNPGTQYENTRHNCGFMAVDTISEKVSVPVKRLKFKSLTAQITLGDVGCLLMKPSTFMNKSGEALIEAMNFYKIPPENTLIIYDDISGEVGNIRIRRKGSDGGHNGMKNIILLSGKDTFPRIKIGIGNKPHKDYPLSDWVLSNFKKDEGERLLAALEKTALATEKIVSGNMDEAMNVYNC